MIKSTLLEKVKSRKTRRTIFIIGMLALPILQFLIFFLYVNTNTILMSFKDLRPHGTGTWSLRNYRTFFSDITEPLNDFGYALRNSLLFGLNDLFLLFISLVLAYFFYKKIRWAGFFRIIFFLPSVISIVIFITAYKNMFVPNGPINSLLGIFGVDSPPKWFEKTSTWQVPLIMLYCLWVGTGYNVLIMGGAMGNLPEDVMEYSRLEGVNYVNEFFRVVIPMIWPTITVGILGSITVMFTLFLQVELMTTDGGALKGNAKTIAYMINKSVKDQDLGRASTYGVIFTVIAMPIIISIRKALDKIGEHFGV